MIVLESKDIRVAIDPAIGGKIRSLCSRSTKKEYFYADPRHSFEPDRGYSFHDISGYDECFPTVQFCEYPDTTRKHAPMGDHGSVWYGPWEVVTRGEKVVMTKDIPEWRSRLERTCYLDSTRSLMLEYVIINYGNESFKYIYSAHPIIAADKHTQLILPEGLGRVFIFLARNAGHLLDKTWVDWPLSNKAHIQPPFSPKRKCVVKLFTERLHCTKAAVIHMDVGEALQFEFDTETLPYLGVLISQGYDSEEKGLFREECFLGLEPTTGIGDDLPTCMSTGTIQELHPNQPVRFWIRLALIDV